MPAQSMTDCYEVKASLAGRGCIANRDIARGETILLVPQPLVFAAMETSTRMCEVCGAFDQADMEMVENTAYLCQAHREKIPIWFNALKRLKVHVDFTALHAMCFSELSMTVKFVCLMASPSPENGEAVRSAYQVLEANDHALPSEHNLQYPNELDEMLCILQTLVLPEELERIEKDVHIKPDLRRILRIQWTNTFNVGGFDAQRQMLNYGLALYPPAVCFFNHSCHPNAARAHPIGMDPFSQTDALLTVRFVALCDIPRGSEICIRYHEGSPREIANAFGFTCNCIKCAQDLSQPCAFECPLCASGLLIVESPPQHPTTTSMAWSFQCNTCRSRMPMVDLCGAQRRLLKSKGY